MAKKAGNSRGGGVGLQGRLEFKKRNIHKGQKQEESGNHGPEQGKHSSALELLSQKWIPKLAELALEYSAMMALCSRWDTIWNWPQKWWQQIQAGQSQKKTVSLFGYDADYSQFDSQILAISLQILRAGKSGYRYIHVHELAFNLQGNEPTNFGNSGENRESVCASANIQPSLLRVVGMGQSWSLGLDVVSCDTGIICWIEAHGVTLVSLYWVYPTTGVVLLFQIFGFAYDVVCVQQDSEEIVEKLQGLASPSLRALTLEEKRKVLKRSKAVTPLPFRVGAFTDYSLVVPLAAWDEIWNQLFFLLSL